MPYHLDVFLRTDARASSAVRNRLAVTSPVSQMRNAFLWRRTQCAQACTRYSYAKAFAAGRTLMTLMRLFWRFSHPRPVAMHFSLRRSVTAVPGVIASADALGPARSRLIAPDSLSSMNIRYRGHVRVTPQPTWSTRAYASSSRSFTSLWFHHIP